MTTTEQITNFSFKGLDKSQVIEDVIEWDIQNWTRAVEFWGEKKEEVQTKNVLVVGERDGGLSLLLSLNGVRCICSDLRPFKSQPLPLHEKYNMTDRISYLNFDVSKMDFEDNQYDLVVFKSVVGAMKNKQTIDQAFKEIHRVLKPGGVLLFVDNLSGSRLHSWARKKFTKWGENWYYPSFKEFKSFADPFSIVHFQTLGILANFGRSETQRKWLGKIDEALEVMAPKSWHYIVSGVLIK